MKTRISYRISDKRKNTNNNILYILILKIDDMEVYKIGVTNRDITDRVQEILLSFFTKYRYFPYCKPKRFRTVAEPYKYEKSLLEYFKEYKYRSEYKFSGSSELLSGVDLDTLLKQYEETVKEDICNYE